MILDGEDMQLTLPDGSAFKLLNDGHHVLKRGSAPMQAFNRFLECLRHLGLMFLARGGLDGKRRLDDIQIFFEIVDRRLGHLPHGQNTDRTPTISGNSLFLVLVMVNYSRIIKLWYVVSAHRSVMAGNPTIREISTSLIECQNLTMRMSMRRFTRLTNAFSRKIKNLCAAVALHFAHYNFVRVHKTLRATPAMAAGIMSSLWTLENLFEEIVQ